MVGWFLKHARYGLKSHGRGAQSVKMCKPQSLIETCSACEKHDIYFLRFTNVGTLYQNLQRLGRSGVSADGDETSCANKGPTPSQAMGHGRADEAGP